MRTEGAAPILTARTAVIAVVLFTVGAVFGLLGATMTPMAASARSGGSSAAAPKA